jgi:nitroimidazol reductase NimA-like FMN-containing flavoprotein (pyridoxamine 5'-phosphate oxidase superfamily)
MKRLSASLKKFTEQQELLRLAFLDLNGFPRALPVWFVVNGGEYYVGTGSDSVKWKSIQKSVRVGWVIDAGKKGKYKGVSMWGEAEEITDTKLRGKLYRAFGKKYFGSADNPKHIEIWGEVDDPGSVYIHLKRQGLYGWEY